MGISVTIDWKNLRKYYEEVGFNVAALGIKGLMHERPVRLNVVYKTGTSA